MAHPLDRATVSEADLNHPMLKDVVPMAPKRTLVTGCNGQLGRAVRALAEERGAAKDFDFCDIDTFDMSDPEAYSEYDWSLYGTVINCGAYTAVDRAETPEGRVAAWKANATAPPSSPAHALITVTLVHVSSDYVFDGTAEVHDEDEPLSPAVRLRPTRPPATSPWPVPAPLHHALQLGHRRGPELRQDDEGPVRPRRPTPRTGSSRSRSLTTSWAA